MSQTEIFHAAVKLPENERPAFLDQACGVNRDLRQEVESLLRAHDSPEEFLRQPFERTAAYEPVAERAGSIIGPYKLREKIGEGGFGVVYVAEQEKPVRRKVALKIIKPGMDTRDVIARFEAERQALALMDHPNVARVLDAGATDSGRPYFVMELVQGVAITEFCDRNSLPTRERLALFADVCRAVQHAHQKGIIHRDLKPTNIMVTLHDGRPVVKVIDFGVSKALSQQLTEKSIYTAYGQMIGTPSYMSPEQAEMSGLGIDTRSDIYSLGVLLYELLTGQTPLDAKRLRASGYAEILRIIREEDPPKPSLKISTLGAQGTVIAQQRQTDLKQLRRDLSGELDWIVMKCLEKDRRRRYETANGVARDIERYLRDDPVEACPPSASYRLSKYWRRHRGLISTAAGFALLLLAGAGVSSWLAVRATLAERRAGQAAAEALQALENEQAAREEAVAAKEKVEWASKRLGTALQLANEGIELYYSENRAAALKKFAEAAETEPDLSTTYVYRRMLYADIGLWDLAAADYDKAFRLSSRNHYRACYEHALLRNYVGDEPGYNAACKEFVRQYGNRDEGEVAMFLLHACSLSARPALDPAELTRRAERLSEADKSPWTRTAAAAAFLRAGNYQRTIALCDDVLISAANSPGGVHRLNHAYKALALNVLGRQQEAREDLSKLEAAIDGWTKEMLVGAVGRMPVSWSELLLNLHWYREAKTSITGSPPAEDPHLLALRERALRVTQEDLFEQMEAGRKAVERHAWDEAAASFAMALDRLPLFFRSTGGGRSFQMEMVQESEVFEKLAALRPMYLLWWSRGNVLASRRQWAQAADCYAQAIQRTDEFARLTDEEKSQELSRFLGFKPTEYELKLSAERTRQGGPVPIILYDLALVRRLAGDEKGYQEVCDRIMSHTDGADHPNGANHRSRALSVSATETIDRAAALRLASQAVAAEPGQAWHLYGLGAAQYRAGQHDEAVRTLEESLSVDPAWAGRCQNFAVLAMACQKLGRHDQARDWLAKARAARDEMEQTRGKERFGFADSYTFSDWLAILILLPEAEKLLTSENPD